MYICTIQICLHSVNGLTLTKHADLDMPNDGIDTKMSESQLPADPTGTNDLLRGILAELKNIGGQLQQQDGRLTEVERKLHGTTNNPDLEPVLTIPLL